MLKTATLSVLALAAALSGCSSEEPALAAPAPPPGAPSLAAPAPPPGAPSLEPVRGPVVQSELRRAMAAMESHRNAEGTYTRDPNALGEHGFTSSKVLIFLPYADDDGYCIEATSSTDTKLVFHASDTTSAPGEGRCPEG